jgi:hypothetical protein
MRNLSRVGALPRRNKPEGAMAARKKQLARGRKQDRARVAGGQDYEIGYESRKTRRRALP